MKLTKNILMEVEQERINQIANHKEILTPMQNFIILSEEVGEVAQALQQGEVWSKGTDKSDLYKELIQVAAVAVKMAERVKRDGTTT